MQGQLEDLEGELEQRLRALDRQLALRDEELAEARRQLALYDEKLAEARRQLAEARRRAREIERSRTWRLGNFLVRASRLLTFRRPVASEGPGELAARIESVDSGRELTGPQVDGAGQSRKPAGG